MNKARRLIFISHANPEDNEFTLWLAARLTSLGYLVWSDITQLFGAEKFWHDIEDAIRNHSAKVVIVLSRISQTKEGVLNEIHTALAVEKKNDFDRFVIPIRIDDLPSTDVTTTLIQKNYIDFHRSWADGLNKLLTFLEKSNVPREFSHETRQESRWIEHLLAGPETVVNDTQDVFSNWFIFESAPINLNFFRVPVKESEVRSRFESFRYPIYPYKDMVATFSNLDEIDTYLPSWQVATSAHTIPIKAILNGEPHSLPELNWQVASRILFYLIRVAWDNAMRNKGLRQYLMANGRSAWYPTVGYSADGWTRYPDINGVERRKRLIGYSAKKKAHWHFGMEAIPSIGRQPHIVVKPHVAFTENGKDLLGSDKRMHSLRRSFCKSWWNARWRDLMLAYTSHIADDSGLITLPVGLDMAITLSKRPVIFESPVSLYRFNEAREIEDETDEQLDELAEDVDWDLDDSLTDDSVTDNDESISGEAS
ncbi:MAG: toll/interleukin-1 receptor domain-containing protein [Candidatus Thiodiazotropha taylori]|nr:toll/interleukin-1 receptor domain-containing protein [Candidatus Thiodiazotropha taylori]MCW4315772.1 toll/interleukin-1 receptor domain-containing protein [Candidatus Thiodiazotropha taylori]